MKWQYLILYQETCVPKIFYPLPGWETCDPKILSFKRMFSFTWKHCFKEEEIFTNTFFFIFNDQVSIWRFFLKEILSDDLKILLYITIQWMFFSLMMFNLIKWKTWRHFFYKYLYISFWNTSFQYEESHGIVERIFVFPSLLNAKDFDVILKFLHGMCLLHIQWSKGN